MGKLQCIICGGKLIMNAKNEGSECENCGTKYSDESMRRMLVEISGGQVEVNGINGYDNLVRNGITFFKANDRENAQKQFHQAVELAPDRYEAYWELAKTIHVIRIDSYDMGASFWEEYFGSDLFNRTNVKFRRYGCLHGNEFDWRNLSFTKKSYLSIDENRLKVEKCLKLDINRYIYHYSEKAFSITNQEYSIINGDIVYRRYYGKQEERKHLPIGDPYYYIIQALQHANDKNRADICNELLDLAQNEVEEKAMADLVEDMLDSIKQNMYEREDILCMTAVLKRIRQIQHTYWESQKCKEAKREKEQNVWAAKGLCTNCGGEYSIFGKCKLCSHKRKENEKSWEETKKQREEEIEEEEEDRRNMEDIERLIKQQKSI